MALFAPLHTGQFVVRPRPLRRRGGAAMMMTVMALLIAYGCFEAGRALTGYSVIHSGLERLRQQQRIEQLQRDASALHRELNVVSINRTMDKEAVTSLQHSLNELQAKFQRQQQELALYESVVSPGANAALGPQVQRLDIQSAKVANRFILRLVLVRPLGSNAGAQGEAVVDVIGSRDGKVVTLPLSTLVGENTSLRFSYKYFQTLEQSIELPPGFQPQTVNVELREGTRAAARQSFAWQVLPS